jgi:hypothetical protein
MCLSAESFSSRGLCITNIVILRGARHFCATGILAVLGHGQDGHGTISVVALPRCASLPLW